jgi:hypothetical protein
MVHILAHLTQQEWPGLSLAAAVGFAAGVAATFAVRAWKVK